mgnify:CR=1 FL=1
MKRKQFELSRSAEAIPGGKATKQRTNAPYSTQIKPNKKEAIICTGSDAWTFAKKEYFHPTRPKLVLPYGNDPFQYRWPVKGLDITVMGFGQLENREQLFKLAEALMIDGAELVFLMVGRVCPWTFIRPSRMAA